MFPNKDQRISKVLFVLTFPLILLSCAGGNTSASFRALRLVGSFPISDSNGQVINNKNEILVYEYNEKEGIVYVMPAFHHFSETFISKSGDYLDDRFIRTDTSYYYIVHEPGKDKAVVYDSLNTRSPRLIDIDSFYSSYTILALDQLVKKLSDHPLIDSRMVDEKRWRELYIPATRKSGNSTDSCIMEYDTGFDEYTFSFSREMDSIKNRKLSRIVVYMSNKSDNPGSTATQAAVIGFEMQKTETTDPHKMKELIKRYHADWRRLKS